MVSNLTAGGGFSGDGGAATSAQINDPESLCFDAAGNMYITDAGNHRIRKVNTSGIISTIAGSGNDGHTTPFQGDGISATTANLFQVHGIYVNSYGEIIFSDPYVGYLFKLSPPAPTASLSGSTVCSGSILTVSCDQTPDQIVWSLDGVGVSTVTATSGSIAMTYTATATGVYSATVTAHSGSATTNAFTVNALPDAGSISDGGSAGTCPGNTINLSETVSGGVWSSSSTSVAIVGTDGTVTLVAGGTATISYTTSNSYCGASATYPVTVNGITTSATNSGIICAGNNVTLSAGATNAVSYSWSGPASFGSTLANPGINGVTPDNGGVYTVTATNAAGCTATSTTTVTVNTTIPTIGISPSATICTGASTSLTATGGTTYSWSPSTALSSTSGATVSASPTSNITYTVTGMLLGCSNTATVSVSIYAPISVTSVSGTAGYPGSSVTINGTGFNLSSGNDAVFFGPVQGAVSSVSTNSMTVTVPAGAAYRPIEVENTGCGVAANSGSLFLPYYDNSANAANTTNFDAFFTLNGGSSPIFNTIADIDGDGKPDIIASASGDNKIYILRNISSGGALTSASFSTEVGFATGTSPQRVMTADIDGDGKLDVVVCNSNSTISVFRNTATSGSITTGSLASQVVFSVAGTPSKVAAADFNGDGKMDLAISTNANNISVLRNTSTSGVINSSSFAAHVDLGTGSNPQGIVATDLDGDGLPDIACGNYGSTSSNNISIIRNTTSGGAMSFASQVYFTCPWTLTDLIAIDVDGDGKKDLASNGYSPGFSVMKNTSTPGTINSSSFAAPVSFSGIGNGRYIESADFDGDGKPDVAMTAYGDNSVYIYRNTSSGGTITTSSFAPNVNFATSGFYGVSVGDLNGDGMADVVVSTSSVSVLKNHPLKPVTGTASICQGGTLTLSEATSGGTWISGATSIATVNSSGVVTGVAVGTATISYRGLANALNAGNIVTTVVTVNGATGISGGGVAICNGNTVTLTATGATSFTWAGSVTDGVAFTPSLGVNTYSLTGTDANGCTTTVTTTVTVNPLASAITGNALLSTAITTTLADAAGAGTWTSGTASAATVGSTTGVVTGVSAGTSLISYYSNTGCGSAGVIVTVNQAGVGINTNGSNNFVTVPNSMSTGDITIEYWMKTTSTGPGGSQWYNGAGLVDAEVAGVVSDFGTSLLGSKVSFGTGSPDISISSTSNVNTGNWVHVAATWNHTTGAMKLYVNGIQEASGTGATGLRIAPPAIYIGKDVNGIYYNGSIDEVRLWNVVRAQSDIQANMNCDVAQQSGLVAYYRFDEGTAGANNTAVPFVLDYSGNNNCGTFTGFALTGSTSNYVAGAVGNCNTIAIGSPAVITGTLSVCRSSTTSLGNSVSGGTWSSSNTSVATIASTGVVTGVAAGTTTITYNLNCEVSTAIVTVNPLPVIGGGANTAVYIGNSTTLTASGGVSYTWTPSGSLSASTGTTVTATPTTTTTYTVTGTSSFGCVNTVAVAVTVSAIPTLSSASSCSLGDLLTVSSALSPTQIVWQLGGTGVYTATASISATGITVAGVTGSAGSDLSHLNGPKDVAFDASGNMYVSDQSNYRVMKYAPGSTIGTVVAGTSGTSGNTATTMSGIQGMFLDNAGSLYFCDWPNGRVQKWVAGATSGTSVATGLSNPGGAAMDASGNLYVASSNCVREFAPGVTTGGTVVAGVSGVTGSDATHLNGPSAIRFDASGNLYVADGGNARVQKFAPGSSTGVTIAGVSGVTGSDATHLNGPCNIVFDAAGNIFICEGNNNRVQKFAPGSSVGTTVAGGVSGGSGATQLSAPLGIGMDNSGNLYAADYNNNRVQKFPANGAINMTYTTPAGGSYSAMITTAAGTITTNAVSVNTTPTPNAGSNVVIYNGNSTTLTAAGADTYSWAPAGSISASSGASVTASPTVTTTYTLTGTTSGCSNTASVTVSVTPVPTLSGSTVCPGSILTVSVNITPTQIIWNLNGTNVYTATATINTTATTVAGVTGVTGSDATHINGPKDVIFDASGNMYVSDQNNYRVMKYAPGSASGTVVAGTSGVSGNTATTMSGIQGMFLDNSNNLYFCDWPNGRVQKWAAGATSGTSVATGLSNPAGSALDASGNLYVSSSHCIRRFAPGVTTGGTVVIGVSGVTGSDATHLNGPNAIKFDASGNLYVMDAGNARVQEFAPGSSTGVTVAGVSGIGGSDATHLSGPTGIVFDATGNIYISDNSNNRVQKFAPGSSVGTTVAGGTGGSGATQLSGPIGIGMDNAGNLYVCDYNNNRVQEFRDNGPANTTYTAATGGNYTAIVTTAAGNATTNTVSINATPSISDGSNVAICIGQSTALTAAGGVTYSWSPSTGLSATTGATVTANPTSTTTYTVVGASGPGCSAPATVTVTVNPLPTVGAGSNVLMYNGASTSLSGTGASTYAWSPSTALSATTGSLVTANPTTTTIYTVTGTSAVGCVNIASVTVSVSPVPTISGNDICPGSVLTLSSTLTPTQIIWQLGGTGVYTATASLSGSHTVVANPSGSTGTDLAHINNATGIYVDGSNNVYVGEGYGSGATVKRWAPGSTVSTVVAGTLGSVGSDASHLYQVYGVTMDTSGNLFVADDGNQRVQKFAPGSTVGVTVCSGFYNNSVIIDPSGNLLVTDVSTNCIRKYAPGTTGGTTGTVIAGTPGVTGTDGTHFGGYMQQMCFDAAGNLYVADQNGNRVMKFAPGSTVGTTIAGVSGVSGSDASHLWSPGGVAVDAGGNVFVGDANNSRILKFAPGSTTGSAGTVFASGIGVSDLFFGGANLYAVAADQVWKFAADGAVSLTYTTASGGNYTAFVTSAAGTVTTNAVSINPTPAVSAGAGVAICTGLSTTLMGTGGATYTWSPSTGLSATTGASVSASPSTTTTYTVVGMSAAGCANTSTITVTVNPLPTVGTTGSTTVCYGNTATLNGTGTLSYIWSGGISNGVPFVAPVGFNVYTVTGTDANGCTNTATATVSINPVPGMTPISGATSICIGFGSALSNPSVDGSMTWSSSNTSVATIGSSGVVSTVAPGTSTITYSVINSSGCIVYTTSTVTVHALPVMGTIAGTNAICQGFTATLTETPTGGIWASTNTGAATINSSGTYSGLSGGVSTISYTYTDGHACTNYATATITINPTPSALTGPASVCMGSVTSLTESDGAGSWSSSSPRLTVDGSGNVTGNTVGLATITFTSPFGCIITRQVTVNTQPVAITGTANICLVLS